MFFRTLRRRARALPLGVSLVLFVLVFSATADDLSAQCDTIISLNTEPGVIGNDGGAFGFRIASAGDVNGDNFDDFIVGAPDEDVGGNEDAGRAYVISGADRAVLFTLTGGAADDRFGFAVAGGGDFDGDGTPDFAVGANEADPGGAGAAGSAYIFSGADGSLLHQVNGTLANEVAGSALAFVGNIPRSGDQPETFADLAIGIPTTNPLGPGGKVIVVGKKIVQNTFTLLFEHVIEETTIATPGNARQFGSSVAAAGDYNGDGTLDIAIGAPTTGSVPDPLNAGRVFVYSGVFTGANLSTTLLNFTGTSAQVRLGSSAGAAGHFDGSTSNLVAFGGRGSGTTQGSVQVFKFGAVSNPVLRLDGSFLGTSFGNNMAFAGDTNGDTFDDLLVGASSVTAAFPGGNAYLIGGSAATGTEVLSGNSRIQFEAHVHFNVTLGETYGFGHGFAGNLDIDNDIVADFLVGAVGIGAAGAFNSAGTVYVFANDGTCDPPAPQNVVVTAPAAAATILGTAVQFTATADNATQVEFFVGATSVGVDSGAAPYEVFFDSTQFPNGAASLTATATNAFGSTTSAAVGVTIDNPPPSNVLITAPAAGTILTGTAVLVTGSADDATSMEFFVNNVSIGVDAAPFAVTFDSTLFPEGAATLDAVAQNSVGTTAAPQVAVVIDNMTPMVAITSPDDGAVIGGSADFTATANDPSGILSVFFTAGPTFSFLDTADPYATIYDSTLDADGPITMSIEVEDGVGLVSTDSITVTVDNTDPLVAITSHIEDEWVSATIAIEAAASDLHLDRVEFFAGGDPIGVDVDGLDGFDAAFDTTTVPDGSLALEAVAYDDAGNSANYVVTVQVDNTFPTKSIFLPADGATVKNNITIVAAVIDTSSGIARLRLFAESQLLVDTANASATVVFDTRTVIDGPLAIICIVEDVAGNVATETVTVIVNNLRLNLRPARLKLSSGGNGDPVELVVRGPSADLLVPVMSHGFQLDLVGGGTISASGGDTFTTDNKIIVQFNRLDVIAVINAAFPIPPSTVDFEIIADGQIMGVDSIRVKP